MFVNGEYRIKFIALRDISVGEELLFDYGKEFAQKHTLSKKLPKAREDGRMGVLFGDELDALDGVDNRKKAMREKVDEIKERRGRGGAKGKMRKSAPVQGSQPEIELDPEPEPELMEDSEEAAYVESEHEDEEDDDEEDDDVEEMGDGFARERVRREIKRPARYTR